jgi:squalene-associated FAD-dependent desaturase
MSRTVHIIGGGLAGLSAAVDLAARGVATVIHEATDQAGGRCRSYDDAQSGMRIDNGTHILLSGNTAALGFLDRIGGSAQVTGAPQARFPFSDLRPDLSPARRRWTLDLGAGRLPLWMFDRGRRAPDTRACDYLALARLMWPARDRALGGVMACKGPAYEQVMRPLLLAALNTEPSESSSDLVRAVVKGSIAQGGGACRPYLAPNGLSAAFVEPAIAYLKKNGGVLHFRHQLRQCAVTGESVTGLDFGDGVVEVGPQDAVVLAVPPYAARSIIPQLQGPDEFRAIVNAHFNITPPPGSAPMLGILNGTAEWIFCFEDRISATISGADRFMPHTKDEIAGMIWHDVQRVVDVPAELPPWQVVRERRATFAATPAQNAKRPGVRTAWRNLALAGDWTDTGLPATIESAVRSGTRAAAFLMQSV